MLGWAILAITAVILHRRGHSWAKSVALAVGFYLIVPVALSLGLIGAIEAYEGYWESYPDGLGCEWWGE